MATGAQPGSQMKRGGKWMENDEPICATSCCLPNYNTRNDFSAFKLRFKERKNTPTPPPQKKKNVAYFLRKAKCHRSGWGLARPVSRYNGRKRASPHKRTARVEQTWQETIDPYENV